VLYQLGGSDGLHVDSRTERTRRPLVAQLFSVLAIGVILPLANFPSVICDTDRGFLLHPVVEFSKRGRKRRRGWLTGCDFLALVVLSFFAFSQGNAAHAHPKGISSSSLHSRAQFALDDFDGDNKPDLASVEVRQTGDRDARYQIKFRMSAGIPQNIGLIAPVGGLQLRSRDVNGDSYPDVVVTTLWSERPVVVLVNDGRGNFTECEPSRFPEAFASSEVSISCESRTNSDASVVLFQRYIPDTCETRSDLRPTLRVIGRAIPGNFDLGVSSDGYFLLGRAPPQQTLMNTTQLGIHQDA
jgi:hypothetical protein